MWYSEILLPRLLCEIGNLWDAAELHVREHECPRIPHIDEEEVTFLLYTALEAEVRAANARSAFALAFAYDLASCRNPVAELNAATWAHGLTGVVTFHKRHLEKRTGADLGMTLLRPRFFDATSSTAGLVMEPQGALCQAKISPIGQGSWGQLTENQKKVLQGRLRYLALLLYRRSDSASAPLKPFEWLKCDRFTSVEEISAVLREPKPATLNSRDFLTELAVGRFGTSDLAIINEMISPESQNQTRSIEIRIDWPDGRPDTSQMAYQHLNSTTQKQEQTVVQFW